MVDESQIDREMSCLKTSLNPAFLQRTGAPVYLYLSPQTSVQALSFANGIPPFDQLLLPPPPVLLRLFDIDIEKGGEVTKEMIALIVEWSPKNIDARYRAALQELEGLRSQDNDKELRNSETDVNYAHEAIWYSLSSKEQVAFATVEGSMAKSLEWDTKPRLLAAVGFTLGGTETSTKQPILAGKKAASASESKGKEMRREASTQLAHWPVLALDNPATVEVSKCKLLRYHFDIDILGVRFLPTSQADQLSEYILQVSAFWQGKAKDLQLALSSSDFPAPNVIARFSETEPVRRLADTLILVLKQFCFP